MKRIVLSGATASLATGREFVGGQPLGRLLGGFPSGFRKEVPARCDRHIRATRNDPFVSVRSVCVRIQIVMTSRAVFLGHDAV